MKYGIWYISSAPWELFKKYTNWFPGFHNLAEVNIFLAKIENLFTIFKEL